MHGFKYQQCGQSVESREPLIPSHDALGRGRVEAGEDGTVRVLFLAQNAEACGDGLTLTYQEMLWEGIYSQMCTHGFYLTCAYPAQ